MGRYFLCLLLFFLCAQGVFAAEPTIQPSNITYSNKTCISITVSFAKGNGLWRMVVIRKAQKPIGAPVDGTVGYNANSQYGFGDDLGGGTYIVYNSIGTSVNISRLQQNTKYYLQFFEHDGAASPDYLTSTVKLDSFTTHNINLDFSFSYKDSCEGTAKVKFTNKSSVTFTGGTYSWFVMPVDSPLLYIDGDSISYTYKRGGYYKVKLEINPSLGCSNSFITNSVIGIAPRPNSRLTLNDSIQCFKGNSFDYVEKTSFAIVSGWGFSRVYKVFGPNNYYDNSTQPKPKFQLPTPGKYQVFYVAETYRQVDSSGVNINKKSGCKDTLRDTIVVVSDPSSGIAVDDSIQCVKGNKFNFTNTAPNLVSFTWKFGDGNTSAIKSPNHTYASSGNYMVEHEAANSEGCTSKDTIVVLVKPMKDASFAPSKFSECENGPAISLVSIDPKAKFSVNNGGSIAGNAFLPKLRGYYTIKAVVSDSFCPDSQTQTIKVIPLPKFSLGKDSIICNNTPVTKTIFKTGTYLWENGSTAVSRTFSNAGTYWAQVTDSGCSFRDSVNIFVGKVPTLKLPNDTLLCKNDYIRIDVPFFAGAKYLWSTGETDTFIYINKPGNYSITITNPCGSASGNIIVNYLDENCDLLIPNAFSPDGNGINDFFEIIGRSNFRVKDFRIYNRWGQKVFDATKEGKKWWDGIYMGKRCMTGQYAYVFVYEIGTGNFIKRGVVKNTVYLSDN